MFPENDEIKIDFQHAFVNFPNNIVFHYLINICSESCIFFSIIRNGCAKKISPTT